MSEPGPPSPSPSFGLLAVKALPLALLGAALLLGLNLLVSRVFERAAPAGNAVAPPFVLVSEEGKEVTPDSLRGAVWIGELTSLRSDGKRPRMTARMRELAKDLPPEAGIRFVSFDVDPERDTVEAIATYAKEHGAPGPILRSSRFVLVDAAGRWRGVYDSEDAETVRRLRADALALVSGAGKPTAPGARRSSRA